MRRIKDPFVGEAAILSIITNLALAAASFGQDCFVWTQCASVGPPPRDAMGIAFDAARGKTVLFGGYGPTINRDTWLWDGATWTLASSTGPEARFLNAMAYDSQRARVVLFGGQGTSTGWKRDTWEWDGSTWISRSNFGPAARHGHALAYDSARGRTVLFGGYSPGGYLGDTWEWNGTTWTQRATTGPTPRDRHAMAFDESRGVTILFGGDGGSYDTWEWNGAVWTQTFVSAPTTIPYSKMAYDADRQRVILFAGPVNPGQAGSTWEWDGFSWVLRSTSGPDWRDNPGMAYDRQRRRLVLFGGGGGGAFNDTWERVNCSSVAGSALKFDGVDDTVRIPRTTVLEPTENLTIEAWIRPDPITDRHSRIVRSAGPFSCGYILSFQQSGEGQRIQLRLHNGDTCDDGFDGTVVVSDTDPTSTYYGDWHHVAGVYSASGNYARLYVDGILKGEVPGFGPLSYSGADVYIGNGPPSVDAEPFDGLIDEVRIWNVARSGAEIAQDYNRHIKPNTQGLVGYWRFDEPSNWGDAFDSSPFANHGTRGASLTPGTDDPARVTSTVPLISNPWLSDWLDYGGHRYRLTEPTIWSCAEAQAVAFGGHLVALNDQAEDVWVNSAFGPLVGGIGPWIGLYQPPGSAEPTGGWIWSNGDSVTYTNWLAAQPDNDAGNEHSAQSSPPSDTWNDLNGSVFGLNGIVEIIDCNGNGIGDPLDIQSGTSPDFDADGVPDECDNCPSIANPSQADCDMNGIGDACELDCDSDGTPDACELDTDTDGVPDDCDNCPAVANPNQSDCDFDGVGDVCQESCAIDTDSDGIVDCCDNCLLTPNPDQADGDNDDVGDACDKCPNVFNPSQDDTDSDALGDLCDNCPNVSNPGQEDCDADGEGDACPCPRRGDMNDDGVIDGADIRLFVEAALGG
ncbi:MAG TPA: LamG-like jellyroll fold domain-containing protein [Phycisphaerae bacterium]|nr:LamG-like jellyroll fold domain-containing protein [Phycisphaerae bacterium]